MSISLSHVRIGVINDGLLFNLRNNYQKEIEEGRVQTKNVIGVKIKGNFQKWSKE